jgi:hypothetical protein
MRTVLGRERDGPLGQPRHYYPATALGAGDPSSGHVCRRGPYERRPHFLDGALEVRHLDELRRDWAGHSAETLTPEPRTSAATASEKLRTNALVAA